MSEMLIKIYKGSSIGNTHIAKQNPNQDAVDSWIAPDGLHFCVAISDGHGSSAHPFSEFGSKFAVAKSLEVYKESFESGIQSLEPLDFFERIITRWSAQCIANFSGQSTRDETHDSILKLYGATLSIAYVSGDSISIASLGDSTVYFRNHSGHFSDFLIYDDSPGEATFSLCQSNPLSRVEIKHIPYASGIIVLSTDGIIKSLKSPADYALIADYYLGLLNTDCPSTQLSADLLSQLDSFSRDGSGDDCTLAMVYIPADTRLNRANKMVSDEKYAHLENSSSKIPPDSKKKFAMDVYPLLSVITLLFITAILSTVILYNPLKNHLLLLIRASFCIKAPYHDQPQNLLIQAKEL